MKSLKLSQQEAARELLRRRRARNHLIDFARYTHHKYIPADHHVRIANALEGVERGEIKRLMIFMPPRHGKSELASRRFPAYCLGRNPERSIIAASYNSELAMDFGRDVRNIVNDDPYKRLFDTRLASDSQRANRWHTNKDGSYVAAGVGSAITGRGADILLIDDPVKDKQEASSEVDQKRKYEWYLSTAYTRLESGILELDHDDLWNDPESTYKSGLVTPFEGAVILIQTRWDDGDLAGRLLADMEKGGDQWTVLSLPAIHDGNFQPSEDGEALWPAKFPLARLKRIRSAIRSRNWSALYQQEPTAADGTLFRREWMKYYTELPDNLQYFITSDFAVTEDGGDFTEIAVWGITSTNQVYVVDWWYGQTTSLTWINELMARMVTFKPKRFIGETGQIRRSIEPILRKMMKERNVRCALDWLPHGTAAKDANSVPFQALCENGYVYWPNEPWAERVVSQLLRFPAGTHDDAVDTCSLMGRYIDKMWGSEPPKEPEEITEITEAASIILEDYAPKMKWR